MPEAHEFLRNLALVLCVAAVTSVVFQRLRQPVIFGYLLAGMIVGPYLPVPLVANQDMVRALAELGVILLMFSIGLEFSIHRLLQVGGPSAIAATTETSIMMGLGFIAGRALGFTTTESIFTGAIVAISSTTIIAKAFAEHNVRGRVNELVFGILIIEDLIGILLVAALTAVGEGGGLSPREILATTLRLALFLTGLIGVGLLLVPRLIRAVTRIGRAETTLIASIGICFAAALLALSLGYSVALGAFIAGSLVAESGETRTVEVLVTPVRDLFVAIFFVAVGMLLDPAAVMQYWWAVALLVAVVMIGKILAVSSGLFLIGEGMQTAVRSGMSLAQIGEFSFIIAAVGMSTGATRDALYAVAIAVSAITTLTTPHLIRAAPRVAAFVDARLPGPLQTFVALYGSWLERLRSSPAHHPEGRNRIRRFVRVLLIDIALLVFIAVGLAVELTNLSNWLSTTAGITPAWARRAVVLVATALAAPLLLGLVRSTQLLGKAIASHALPLPGRTGPDMAAAPRRALEVTLQFALLVAALALLVAITQPFAPRIPGILIVVLAFAVFIAAVWRAATNLQGHAIAGAEVIAAALTRGGVEGSTHSEPSALDRMRQMLPGLGEPVAMTVEPGSRAVNRTLADVDLRGVTGATVLAILRGEERIVSPRGDVMLQPGDVIAVAGTNVAIDGVRGIVSAAGSEITAPVVP